MCGRQALGAAVSGCRTPGSVPIPGGLHRRSRRHADRPPRIDGLPESLHKHVVAPAAGAVHADLNAVPFQDSRELQARELAALIGVEEIRYAIVGHGIPDRLRTEIGRQPVGQPPRQHPVTGPVHDRTPGLEGAMHRNVGDINRPDMVRAGDLHVA